LPLPVISPSLNRKREGTFGNGVKLRDRSIQMSEPRNAEHIVWEAPAGVQMSLVPEEGGSLQVEAANGLVTITGKQCRHRQGESAKNASKTGGQSLAEVHMTVLTDRCQITWKSVVGPGRAR
jgi:hypothetical protein